MIRFSTAKKLLPASILFLIGFLVFIAFLKNCHPQILLETGLHLYFLRILLVSLPFFVFYLVLLIVFTSIRLSTDLSSIRNSLLDENFVKNPIFLIFIASDYKAILAARKSKQGRIAEGKK